MNHACQLRKLATIAAWAALLAAGESLQPPELAATFPKAVLQGKSLGKFQNGRFLTHDTPAAGKISEVYAYDRTGALVTEAKLSVPGAIRVDITDQAAAPTGVIAVAGVAYTGDGVYSSFLAWIGADGAIQRMARTWPFGAWSVVFSSDGSLWAAGVTKKPDLTEDTTQDVLRRYDRDGRLLNSLLPATSFPLPQASQHSFLLPLAGRVAFYSTTGREWIEASQTGSLLARSAAMQLPLLAAAQAGKSRVLGAAALTSGRVYVGMETTDSSGKEHPAFFRVDPSSPNWQQVDASALLAPGRFGTIVGADGDRLVIEGGSQFWWAAVK
jgi:hypothetical protein